MEDLRDDPDLVEEDGQEERGEEEDEAGHDIELVVIAFSARRAVSHE